MLHSRLPILGHLLPLVLEDVPGVALQVRVFFPQADQHRLIPGVDFRHPLVVLRLRVLELLIAAGGELDQQGRIFLLGRTEFFVAALLEPDQAGRVMLIEFLPLLVAFFGLAGDLQVGVVFHRLQGFPPRQVGPRQNLPQSHVGPRRLHAGKTVQRRRQQDRGNQPQREAGGDPLGPIPHAKPPAGNINPRQPAQPHHHQRPKALEHPADALLGQRFQPLLGEVHRGGEESGRIAFVRGQRGLRLVIFPPLPAAAEDAFGRFLQGVELLKFAVDTRVHLAELIGNRILARLEERRGLPLGFQQVLLGRFLVRGVPLANLLANLLRLLLGNAPLSLEALLECSPRGGELGFHQLQVSFQPRADALLRGGVVFIGLLAAGGEAGHDFHFGRGPFFDQPVQLVKQLDRSLFPQRITHGYSSSCYVCYVRFQAKSLAEPAHRRSNSDRFLSRNRCWPDPLIRVLWPIGAGRDAAIAPL